MNVSARPVLVGRNGIRREPRDELLILGPRAYYDYGSELPADCEYHSEPLSAVAAGDFHYELHASRVYARTRQKRARSSPTPSTFADLDTLDGCWSDDGYGEGEEAGSSTLLNSKGSTRSTTSTVLPAPSLVASLSLGGGSSSLSIATFSATAPRRRRRRNSTALYRPARHPGSDSPAGPVVLPFSAQRVVPRHPHRSLLLPPPTTAVAAAAAAAAAALAPGGPAAPLHPPPRRNDVALIRACATGSLVTVTALLAAGTDPNARAEPPAAWPERRGCGGAPSALHVATAARHRPIVRELLRRGARADAAARPAGRVALHVAAAAGDAPMARLLLEHGAPVDSRCDRGYTPLHAAAMGAHAAVARLLARAGAAVDATAQDGLTPLHHVAMRHGSDEVTAVLLEAGADVRVRTRWLLGNKRAIEIARERGHERMERRLRLAEGLAPEPEGERWLRDLRRGREMEDLTI